MTEANPSEGFIIDMTVPGRKRQVALVVLRGRLKMATHFKRTDTMALHAARGWAAKEENPPPYFKTMRQALVWVEAECEKFEAAENG